MLKSNQKMYGYRRVLDFMAGYLGCNVLCRISDRDPMIRLGALIGEDRSGRNASLNPMTPPHSLRHSHSSRWLAASAMLLIAFTVGCASPAPPRPPSLNLPEIVKDLSAERVGTEVRLRWTTPEKTTDKLFIKDPVKNPMTAEICRIVSPTAASSAASVVAASSGTPAPGVAGGPACVPVTPAGRLRVKPGASEWADALPATLTVDPAGLLAYRVQIFNAKGHSAGLSAETFAASGAVPPAVEELHATSSREGAMLEWKRIDSTASVVLDRHLVGADGADVQPPAKDSKKTSKPDEGKSSKKRKAAKTSKAPQTATAPALSTTASTTQTSMTQAASGAPAASGSKTLQLAPPAPVEVRLRTPREAADAGGTIDHTAQKGVTYHYSARRVREISVDGHKLELRSVASAPVTLAVRDIFPPGVPTDLEAVPGGATASDRSIDLSWTPDTDLDVVGYIVYRQDVDSAGAATGTATRLNASPVADPAYRDQTALTGHRYAYRVSAIDAAGNESAPSAEAQEMLREQ